MEEKTLTISYKECLVSELSQSWQDLVSEAKIATVQSYAPYSHFAVGAAALMADMKMVRGCNQENCAYPSGLCAERSALFSAGAQYGSASVQALAVVAHDANGIWCEASPCGACRQVMWEVEQRQRQPMAVLVLLDENHVRVFSNVGSLLPFGFDF